jgi:hypothetical protein
MATCYHREAFIAGMLITLFIFEGVILYGDMIIEWFKRIIKVLK